MIASKVKAAAAISTIEAPRRHVAVELANPVQHLLKDYVDANRNTSGLKVVQRNSHLGQTVAICGAGPSLAEHAIEGADQIWACNSALPFLYERGYTNLTGVAIDQTKGMLREWADPPPVPYMLGSSVDPELVQHLLARGCDVTFFHNAVGIEDEFDYYCRTWPETIVVGQGWSVTSRMIGVAMYMGFKRIDIYGADCAFADGHVTHANGETAEEAYGNPLILQGIVNGREWRTRYDMLIDAVDIVRRVRKSEGRIRLIGDTLPVALIGEPDDFLDRVARRINPGEEIPQPS